MSTQTEITRLHAEAVALQAHAQALRDETRAMFGEETNVVDIGFGRAYQHRQRMTDAQRFWDLAEKAFGMDVEAFMRWLDGLPDEFKPLPHPNDENAPLGRLADRLKADMAQ